MKEEWEAASSKPPPPKPSRQTSTDPSSSEGGVADTYCYELLSMVIGLSQSEVGCAFLSEQEKLIKDLVTLLHVATVRIQMQVSVVQYMYVSTVHVVSLPPRSKGVVGGVLLV